MDDIVVRLRHWTKGSGGFPPIMDEAADEIERLRENLVDLRGAAAEIDRLRNQICVMEIDRQPEPDLREATFKAFGEEDDGHRNQ